MYLFIQLPPFLAFSTLHTDVINKNYSEYEAKEVWQKYQHVTKFMGVLWMAVKIIVLLI